MGNKSSWERRTKDDERKQRIKEKKKQRKKDREENRENETSQTIFEVPTKKTSSEGPLYIRHGGKEIEI